MKISCEIIFVKLGPGMPKPTRKARGFILLSKERDQVTKAKFYQMQFAVPSDRNGHKFRLDPLNMPRMIPTITDNKKCSFSFHRPPIQILVSRVHPTELYSLLKRMRDIRDGLSVNLEGTEPIKCSDFKPRRVEIVEAGEYEKSVKEFSTFLETLVIHPMDMRVGDRRWKKNTNMLTLDVSGNAFGLGPQLDRLTDAIHSLDKLCTLDLSSCSLGRADNVQKTTLFKSLPVSLINLSLKSNMLEVFPQIFHLRALQYLNLSGNELRFCPSQILVFKKMQNLDLSSNSLNFLPFLASDAGPCFPDLRELKISGNTGLLVRDIVNRVEHRLIPHPFGEEYQNNGVDTLKTIAANVCHQHQRLLGLSADFLPRELQIDYMSYCDENSGISSLDYCFGCRRHAHIRSARIYMYTTRRLSATVDAVHDYVRLVMPFCSGCTRRCDASFDKVWKKYWIGNIEDL